MLSIGSAGRRAASNWVAWPFKGLAVSGTAWVYRTGVLQVVPALPLRKAEKPAHDGPCQSLGGDSDREGERVACASTQNGHGTMMRRGTHDGNMKMMEIVR